MGRRYLPINGRYPCFLSVVTLAAFSFYFDFLPSKMVYLICDYGIDFGGELM